ncbi:hypothetical protein X727_27550 [Mesorhizobium sp. L103C119B0]|nr:hypothetical protein X753_32105 [Mesorhizobium sp. LNJC399B00]ESZ66794.1 hypothetical protein X727_27550 [Mesorhizobium sp. L103C119B0]
MASAPERCQRPAEGVVADSIIGDIRSGAASQSRDRLGEILSRIDDD